MSEPLWAIGARAASEALFPSNELGIPDFRATEMERRMADYLDALPSPQRRLIRSLFVVVELGSIPLCAARFSRLTPDARAAAVRRWRLSRWATLRLLGDALKATTTLVYMSHPEAMRYLGAYKTCARDGDTLPVRADALSEVDVG